MTTLELNNGLRFNFLARVKDAFEGEEILATASNEIAIPTVDCEGNEKWVVVTVKVPKDDYDGYACRDEYLAKCKAAAERKAKAEALKAKKLAKKKDTK